MSLHTPDSSLYNSLQELMGWRFHVKHRQLNSVQKVMDQVSGQHHSLRKGSGMVFSEVRQYQAGDDIRHIDWRVSARTGKVHTKLFSEEHEKPILVISEQSPALFFGSQVRLKSAQVLNLATILGWTALQQGDAVGGLVFSPGHAAWVAPKRQQKTWLHWLQQAVKLQQGLQAPGKSQPHFWQQASAQLLKTVKPGSKLFLIGDLLSLNDATLNNLQRLRQHSDLSAIHVYDELEMELPALGWLSLSDGAFDAPALTIDSSLPITRQHYREQFEQAGSQAKTRFRQHGIPLTLISAQQAPLEALLKQQLLR
ncbi:DUF58 domain-containing protein [Thiomicrorhabdus cannonii]|uniref:DUF58 domain-containing protein n=1 Tax=Thiomicrorhabdus cannonii TaxID=2748011 RepID=UPI0015BD0821|nr:DUF58 domain-containing protein [Thiomicrorhabdus cannonii]